MKRFIKRSLEFGIQVNDHWMRAGMKEMALIRYMVNLPWVDGMEIVLSELSCHCQRIDGIA